MEAEVWDDAWLDLGGGGELHSGKVPRGKTSP